MTAVRNHWLKLVIGFVSVGAVATFVVLSRRPQPVALVEEPLDDDGWPAGVTAPTTSMNGARNGARHSQSTGNVGNQN